MSDPPSGAEPLRARTLLERLSALLLRAPEDREQLLQLLRQAHADRLLDAEALSMIEGVLQVAELTARDLMVPRAQTDAVDIGLPPAEFVEQVIQSGHSRLPVVDGDLDRVVGIVHAKDLLRCGGTPDCDLRALIRPATFIPESKRLNDLLRDFRTNHRHLAMVVDEYGGVSGLITIEDVLEQIVGDIEDEFDLDDEDDRVVPVEPGEHGPRWRVQARAPIELVNERLEAALPEDDFDTVGGLVTGTLGRVPHRGETLMLGGLRVEVLRADARQPHLLLIERVPSESTDGSARAEPPDEPYAADHGGPDGTRRHRDPERDPEPGAPALQAAAGGPRGATLSRRPGASRAYAAVPAGRRARWAAAPRRGRSRP